MSSVRPGDVLAGKYRVERVLGQGGMGYVVAARHLQLDQLVAMKFLRQGALDETEATGRFLREAKATVRLRNEHVAKVYDVGTLEGGEPYIVMEYLDGADLSTLSKQQGRLPAHEVVEYTLQACEALAEAHSLGIVHRDIKLANLFVTRGPTGSPLLKVLDFGISKTNPFGESEHDMTRTTSMLGSPRFMSPEQMRDARAVDARSDIWSIGVVMYRLLSGQAPFEADTLGRLLTMVMHEAQPPLVSLVPDLAPGLYGIVDRCLEKDPTRRWTTVHELASALVPYSVDPARARATADRIGATLGASVSISFNITGPSQHGPPLGAPGAGDANTGSPWTGTNGGLRRTLPPARSSVAWMAVAVAATLIAGTIVLKMHRDRETAVAAAATPVPVMATPTTIELPNATPAATAFVIAPTPVAAPAPPGVSPAPVLDARPAPATAAAKPATAEGERPATTRRLPVVQPTVVRRVAPPRSPNDGIPSTRN